VVEGSLDLAQLSAVLSKPTDLDISVVDQEGHVAYSTATGRRPVLSDMPAAIPRGARGFGRVFNNDPRLITSKRETFYAIAPAALGWSVLTEVPRYVALKSAELNSTAVFLACLLLFAGSLASVRLANRVVTEPLVDLELQAAALQWGTPMVEPATAGRTLRAPREIAVVRDALTNAGKRISESFLSMQRALADRDAALAERDQTVRHLDTLVHERTLELQSERDRAAQASVAKSAFLANMSHELRTPLNVMLGRAEAFAEGIYGPLSPAQREAFGEVDAQGRRLLALIGDTLDLARIESGKLSVEMLVLDVLPLLREVVASFQDIAATREVALSLGASVSSCVVHADAFRLRQIIVNLVGNAVKFTSNGGHVRVTVEVRSDDGTPVAIHVADTGIGIPSDRIPIIFGAFEQADASATRVHGGAGLGLTICRALSDAMGMRVSVVSEVGQGSTFSLHFAGADAQAWHALHEDPAVAAGAQS
jgi:signal transduction histidine kinase